MVNIITISPTGWKIVARIDKWTVALSVNEQILQHMIKELDKYCSNFHECCNG